MSLQKGYYINDIIKRYDEAAEAFTKLENVVSAIINGRGMRKTYDTEQINDYIDKFNRLKEVIELVKNFPFTAIQQSINVYVNIAYNFASLEERRMLDELKSKSTQIANLLNSRSQYFALLLKEVTILQELFTRRQGAMLPEDRQALKSLKIIEVKDTDDWSSILIHTYNIKLYHTKRRIKEMVINDKKLIERSTKILESKQFFGLTGPNIPVDIIDDTGFTPNEEPKDGI